METRAYRRYRSENKYITEARDADAYSHTQAARHGQMPQEGKTVRFVTDETMADNAGRSRKRLIICRVEQVTKYFFVGVSDTPNGKRKYTCSRGSWWEYV